MGSNQPANLCSMVSVFVGRLLESIISRLAANEISIFLLVSVAEQAGLSFALSETPKTGFLNFGPMFAWRNKKQSSGYPLLSMDMENILQVCSVYLMKFRSIVLSEGLLWGSVCRYLWDS